MIAQDISSSLPDLRERSRIFERNRERLRRLAYRLLGSLTDADDLVQDVYVRWHTANTDNIRSPDAWLTTATSRLCVDRMRARHREREAYPGSWLPEPFSISEPAFPDVGLDQADDLSMALLVLLERLMPEERVAFLLHDVCDRGHGEIALILGKNEPACRQLLHRARKRIRADRPRFRVNDEMYRGLIGRFLEALHTEDEKALISLMALDATLTSDSGGQVRATLAVIRGNGRIARLLLGLRRKRPPNAVEKLMLINGEFGIVTYAKGRPASVLWFDIEGVRIMRLYRILNPAKLTRVPAAGDGDHG
jgi:RNA polymerase sigma-70 factor (ECF subfamily)